MAAHRIRATTTNNASLPRCKSEGTLIDLSDGVSEASLTDVKGQLLKKRNLTGRVTSLVLITSNTSSEIWFYVKCKKSKPCESSYQDDKL